MKMSKHERNATAKVNALYDALVSMADPETGKVAMSGTQAGTLIECGATAARSYLGQLVMDGRIIQISTPKTGTPTVYRIPAMTRGDIRTTFTDILREKPVKDPKTYVPDKPKEPASIGPLIGETLQKEPTKRDYGKIAKSRAKTALMEQEDLIGKLLTGYLIMYKALEEIAYDGD